MTWLTIPLAWYAIGLAMSYKYYRYEDHKDPNALTSLVAVVGFALIMPLGWVVAPRECFFDMGRSRQGFRTNYNRKNSKSGK